MTNPDFPDVIGCYNVAGGTDRYNIYVLALDDIQNDRMLYYAGDTGLSGQFTRSTGAYLSGFGDTDCNDGPVGDVPYSFDFVASEGGGGGGATSSPYIIDVGSTVMLGGILAFLIAYWLVGLARSKRI